MKSITQILILLFIFSFTVFGGDNTTKPPPTTSWLSFDAGLKEAKSGSKKILVDVYTDWCGWCKKMDTEVFNHTIIAPYLNEQYVLIKLNAESSAGVNYKEKKSSERELARAFGVTGYPTILFLEPTGELITPLPGFVKAEDFLPILKYIGESHYKTKDWNAYLGEYKKNNGKKPQ